MHSCHRTSTLPLFHTWSCLFILACVHSDLHILNIHSFWISTCSDLFVFWSSCCYSASALNLCASLANLCNPTLLYCIHLNYGFMFRQPCQALYIYILVHHRNNEWVHKFAWLDGNRMRSIFGGCTGFEPVPCSKSSDKKWKVFNGWGKEINCETIYCKSGSGCAAANGFACDRFDNLRSLRSNYT